MNHPLVKLVAVLVVWGAAIAATPVRAQTLLQDLDPGSLTEGIFVDMIYYPESNSVQKGRAPAKENKTNKNAKQGSNKKS
jgi:hypothetical protein